MGKDYRRILIVEDDPDIGAMIKIMLEYHNFSAMIVQRAEKVIETMHAERFDLVVMDMLLSGVNGMDICARIKKDEVLTPIPVIMISAHPNAREISEGAGAEDFLSKPFDMQEMLTKVDRLVNGPKKN